METGPPADVGLVDPAPLTPRSGGTNGTGSTSTPSRSRTRTGPHEAGGGAAGDDHRISAPSNCSLPREQAVQSRERSTLQRRQGADRLVPVEVGRGLHLTPDPN